MTLIKNQFKATYETIGAYSEEDSQRPDEHDASVSENLEKLSEMNKTLISMKNGQENPEVFQPLLQRHEEQEEADECCTCRIL